MTPWTAGDIPDQSGRRAIVTGANSGLGLVTARELARAGAAVILACRSTEKGERALSDVQSVARDPDAIRVEALDLADLTSVMRFADTVGGEQNHLDLLVNNAGIMAPPRRETVDGFESQFGTNHLGHFALTGRLMDSLLRAPAPRVVTLSSLANRIGRLRFGDLQMRRRYNNWLAYGQSKLANLMFTVELQRRAGAAGTDLLSVAAHPGYSATNLQFAGPEHPWERRSMFVMNRTIAQSSELGALPTLYAATLPDVPPGAFVGPDGRGEMRGHPHITRGAGRAYDEAAARRLWEESEELTGVHYQFARAAAA